MNSPITTIRIGSMLDDALRLLREEEIGGAPVVDSQGEPVGVLSRYDILTFLDELESRFGDPGDYYMRSNLRWDRESGSFSNLASEDADLLRQTEVGDVMTQEVVAVARSSPLEKVVETMHDRGIHRILVAEGKRLVGVITTMDVLAALLGRRGAEVATA